MLRFVCLKNQTKKLLYFKNWQIKILDSKKLKINFTKKKIKYNDK